MLFVGQFDVKKLVLIALWLWGAPATADWSLIYKHDQHGNKLVGEKASLINAIRLGFPVRIGWGVYRENGELSVEHTAIPEFLSMTNGKEVFVQIPEHIAQTSYWDEEFQDFNSAQIVWKGLLSTTGRFMAVWYNRSSGQTIRRYPQRVTISWFVDHKGPIPANSPPLYHPGDP